jgi:hypothetical protein
MIVKLHKPEIDLLKAIHYKFRYEDIKSIAFDGYKSVWVVLEGSKYHGIMDGENAIWTKQ